ncbi:hypothetical protein ACHAP4_004207 [Fusarium culmorum]
MTAQIWIFVEPPLSKTLVFVEEVLSIRTMYKPKVPVKSIEQVEPLLFQETPLPKPAEPPRIASKKEAPKKEASKKEAPKKGVRSILPTPETPRHDRSLTTSSTSHHEKVAFYPNSKSSNICCSCESETGDESPIIPPHFPPNPISRPNREADIFWRDACMEVQSPDEPVHAHDVIVRIMTRKGGIARPWPRLEEGLAAIEMMGKDTVDITEILRRQEEEEALAKAKEERRLANKRLYRPRGQIDRERTERRAALAAQKARVPETDRADDTPEWDVDDADKNSAKGPRRIPISRMISGRQAPNTWTTTQWLTGI